MTKRFMSNGSMIFDNRKPLNTIETVDLLNELNDENEQLKQTIETQNFNYENAKGIIHSSEHQIQQLQDEMEQLKKELKELQ